MGAVPFCQKGGINMTGNQIAYANYLRQEAADRVDALHKAETRRLQEQEIALKEWSAKQDVRIRDLLAEWQMRRDRRQLELEAQRNAIQEAFNTASIAKDYYRIQQDYKSAWSDRILKANLARDELVHKRNELSLKEKTFDYSKFKDTRAYDLDSWKARKQYGFAGTEQLKAYGAAMRGAASLADSIVKGISTFKKKK